MTSSVSKHIFLSSDPLDLGIDDDQHDYDSVASDEDTDSELTAQNNNNTQRSNRAKVRHPLTLCEELIYVLPHELKKMQMCCRVQLLLKKSCISWEMLTAVSSQELLVPASFAGGSHSLSCHIAPE